MILRRAGRRGKRKRTARRANELRFEGIIGVLAIH